MSSSRVQTCSNFSRTGFTLIEVLLGVMILALGLLGLGAVFPLVVKQQRGAQDSVVGVSAGRGAEAIVRAHSDLSNSAVEGGLARLSWELYKIAFNDKNSHRASWDDVFKHAVGELYADNGNLRITSTNQTAANEVVIRPVDRLYPSADLGNAPLFVWDIAPSLASPVHSTTQISTPTAVPLRLTVFVRRIDPGIRVPSGKSLSQLIRFGADSQGRTLVPIAVDKNVPTLNGIGNYSKFLYPTVTNVYQRFGGQSGQFSVVEFANAADYELGAVRQIGQQLVDIDGNVYTVTALPDEQDEIYSGNLNKLVVVSPPLPVEYFNYSKSAKSLTPKWQLQLLCTPQIPASIVTFLTQR